MSFSCFYHLITHLTAHSSATTHAAHTEIANGGLFVHVQNLLGTGKAATGKGLSPGDRKGVLLTKYLQ